MSQNDFTIANQTFPNTRSDINSALQALAGLSSGASAPSTTYAYQLWADTTNTLLKIRNGANSAWVTIGTLDAVNLALLPLAGGSLAGAVNWIKGSNIASAATADIGAATGNVVDITGTTTITSLGSTGQAGTVRVVRFTGVLTLTYHATNLILPGAASITTAANDVAVFVSLGSGSWYCAAYQPASGRAVVGTLAATQAEMEAASSATVMVTPLNIKWSPGIVKKGVRFYYNAGVPTIISSFGVSSLTDTGAGQITVNFTTSFSTADYIIIPGRMHYNLSGSRQAVPDSRTPPTASSCFLTMMAGENADTDSAIAPGVSVTFLGDE